MTCDHEQTARLFQLANEKSLVLFECFMYLHHRQFQRLEKILSGGEIGEVVSITAQFSYPHKDKENVRYKASLGGGAVLDSGVYPLSAILALAKRDPLSVTGSINRPNGYEVDTSGSARLEFSSGIVGHAVWGMGLDYRSEIEILGRQGKIKVHRAFSKPEDLESEIILVRNGREQLLRTGTDNHFINMFEFFSLSHAGDQAVLDKQRISLGVADAISRLSRLEG